MEWTEQETESGCKAFADVNPDGDTDLSQREVRAIMSCAVELSAARAAGDARADTIAISRTIVRLEVMTAKYEPEATDALTRLGTTVATLQAKVDELERQQAQDQCRIADREAIAREVLERAVRAERERDDAHADVEKLKSDRLSESQDWELAVAQERTKVSVAWTQIEQANKIATAAIERRDRAEAELERLKALALEFSNDLDDAEFRLAAIRERGLEELERLDQDGRDKTAYRLRWVLEGDAPQEAKSPRVCTCASREAVIMGALARTNVPHDPANTTCPQNQRYPCSPTCTHDATCTHDDAANPGHPFRVKDQSVAVARTALGMPDPERVKDRSEATATATNLNTGHPDALPEGPLEVVDPAFIAGHEQGAEAMRAACLLALHQRMAVNGFSNRDSIWNDFTAAIEGAAP